MSDTIEVCDWFVIAYDKDNRVIEGWLIENRTECEAESEAEADLPDGTDDWTMGKAISVKTEGRANKERNMAIDTQQITPEMEKAYLESNGSACPFCGSDEKDGGHVEVDEGDGVAWRYVTCDVCNKSWQEVYNLVGISPR